jgi:hypothetical protein
MFEGKDHAMAKKVPPRGANKPLHDASKSPLSSEQPSKIKHVVQLMLENRSFDQMLGFLYTDADNKSLTGDAYDGGLTPQKKDCPDPSFCTAMLSPAPAAPGAFRSELFPQPRPLVLIDCVASRIEKVSSTHRLNAQDSSKIQTVMLYWMWITSHTTRCESM